MCVHIYIYIYIYMYSSIFTILTCVLVDAFMRGSAK